MNNILFVGSFLSAHDGSVSYGESLSKQLNTAGYNCILSSDSQNKIQRLFEIIFSLFRFQGNIVHVDVFSDNAFYIATIAAKIAKARRKKLILTLRGGKFIEFFEHNPRKIHKVLRQADILQTPSLFIQNSFIAKGYNIRRIPNAVDLLKFSCERSSVKRHSILWVRAFTGIYNPGLAIQILKELTDRYPDTTLTMVGPDKGIMQEMKKLAADLHVEDRIAFTGPIAHHLLPRYFQLHEVYINTTSYESFGNAVFEAAACGIPIVSTAVGEIPFLWNAGEDILLVEEKNAKEFAKMIIRLFNNKDLAGSISESARKKAECYSWENIIPKWIAMLEELAN
jgi:glycosyltransferase involved in cell wall biosynthesis